MKTHIIISYSLLFFGTLFLLFWFDSPPSERSALAFTPPTPTMTPLPTPTPTPRPGQPISILIPKLGVNTTIESVGKDPQGKMDVPKTWETVGWYNQGTRPGEIGSAVIDGHYDTNTGSPAVFYNLSKLSIGDSLIVIDELGKNYTYTITNIQSFPIDQVPLDYIFTTADKARLNLITCDGSWDHANHNYTKRIVIFSELQHS